MNNDIISHERITAYKLAKIYCEEAEEERNLFFEMDNVIKIALPIQWCLGESKKREKYSYVDWGNWDKIKQNIKSFFSHEWGLQNLCARADLVAFCNPERGEIFSKRKVRLVFSVFHYLRNPEDADNHYYRQVVEQSLEGLGIEPVMSEGEILASAAQLAELARTDPNRARNGWGKVA